MVGHARRQLARHVDGDDVGAFLSHPHRVGPPLTARRSGDECDLTREPPGHVCAMRATLVVGVAESLVADFAASIADLSFARPMNGWAAPQVPRLDRIPNMLLVNSPIR